MNLICHRCGKTFSVSLSRAKAGRLYCSRACYFPELAVRFWKLVDRSAGCWRWKGRIEPTGYGSMSVKDRTQSAHRISWTLANGPIPKGLWVLHRCDVRDCVNPSHLFLGTPSDNTADMVQKGRGISGSRHPLSKLTAEQVADIRAAWANGAQQNHLAAEYGVRPSMIYSIVHRHRWKAVTSQG